MKRDDYPERYGVLLITLTSHHPEVARQIAEHLDSMRTSSTPGLVEVRRRIVADIREELATREG